jgi:CheY-like chemotaxis protein
MSRILIADDEPAILKKVSARLEKAGFTTEAVLNGAEALRRLCENARGYDLLVLDVMMPVLDGFELLKQIRRDPRLQNIPVVMLTYPPDMADDYDTARQNRYIPVDPLHAYVYKAEGFSRWGSKWEETLAEVTEMMLKTTA